MSEDAVKRGRHAREPWGHPGDASVRVHRSLSELKGTSLPPGDARTEHERLYDLAKHRGDHDAAAALVEGAINDDTMDALVDAMMAAEAIPQVVAPYPAYDDDDGDGFGVLHSGPRNVIPFTFAAHLCEVLGAELNNEIVQAARVGRTKLAPFPRFLFQPRFEGRVRARQPHILVDDVFTMGGTLAALRSHIVAGGGTIIAVSTLAHKEGFDQPFAIRKETLSQLRSLYGSELDELWMELIGHGTGSLSENEGQTLVRFALTDDAGGSGPQRLHALRDRLAEAAAKCE